MRKGDETKETLQGRVLLFLTSEREKKLSLGFKKMKRKSDATSNR
jgi:hypothetical protein